MDKKEIFIYVGIFLIVMFIVYAILKRVGIIQSTEAKKRDERVNVLSTSTSDWYLPDYHTNFPSAKKLSNSTAIEIAKKLHEAMYSTPLKNMASLGLATLGTDTTTLFAQIAKIKSKVQFSQVANEYNILYNEDLYTSILSELSDKELLKLTSYVDGLSSTYDYE